MKKVLFIVALTAGQAFAIQRANYAEFEKDATNAIANIGVLASDSYAKRLHLCRNALDAFAIGRANEPNALKSYTTVPTKEKFESFLEQQR